MPSGVGQSRQDADVDARARRLRQIEQMWVECEAEIMWTGHNTTDPPRLPDGWVSLIAIDDWLQLGADGSMD
jgi:hypothetical protein